MTIDRGMLDPGERLIWSGVPKPLKETVVSGGEGHTIRRDGFVAIAGVAEVERLFRAAIKSVAGSPI